MSQEAFEAREAMLDERAAIPEAGAEHQRDGRSYAVDEVREMPRAARSAGVVLERAAWNVGAPGPASQGQTAS